MPIFQVCFVLMKPKKKEIRVHGKLMESSFKHKNKEQRNSIFKCPSRTMAVWEQFILKFSSLSFTLKTANPLKWQIWLGSEQSKYDLQHSGSPFSNNEAERCEHLKLYFQYSCYLFTHSCHFKPVFSFEVELWRCAMVLTIRECFAWTGVWRKTCTHAWSMATRRSVLFLSHSGLKKMIKVSKKVPIIKSLY